MCSCSSVGTILIIANYPPCPGNEGNRKQLAVKLTLPALVPPHGGAILISKRGCLCKMVRIMASSQHVCLHNLLMRRLQGSDCTVDTPYTVSLFCAALSNTSISESSGSSCQLYSLHLILTRHQGLLSPVHTDSLSPADELQHYR